MVLETSVYLEKANWRCELHEPLVLKLPSGIIIAAVDPKCLQLIPDVLELS